MTWGSLTAAASARAPGWPPAAMGEGGQVGLVSQ
jgi:hypothetical protein